MVQELSVELQNSSLLVLKVMIYQVITTVTDLFFTMKYTVLNVCIGDLKQKRVWAVATLPKTEKEGNSG